MLAHNTLYNIANIARRPPMDLTEEFTININWEWVNAPSIMVGALTDAGTNDSRAFMHLCSGQEDNAHVQEVYKLAFGQFGEQQCWQIIQDTTTVAPDWAAFKRNTDWQYSNNIESLASANGRWDASVDWRGNTYGIAALLGGQQHDPPVMDLYRACWASDADQVKEIVGTYFL
jgi:hypothetical protein